MHTKSLVYCFFALQATTGSLARPGESGTKIVRREIVRRADGPAITNGLPPQLASVAASITSVAGHVASQVPEGNGLLSDVQKDIAVIASKAQHLAGQHPGVYANVTPALVAAGAKITSAASIYQKQGASGVLDYAKSEFDSITADLPSAISELEHNTKLWNSIQSELKGLSTQSGSNIWSKIGAAAATVVSDAEHPGSSHAASKRNIVSDLSSDWNVVKSKVQDAWERAEWKTSSANNGTFCTKDSTTLQYRMSTDLKANTVYGICVATTPNAAPVATLTDEPVRETLSTTQSA
ncbi:hypothetical protein EV356DRAFT_508039 [Viridothelium virens]|uniref:Uncharacterized protein n=1 Tax=Viridothelium virens TaxID=1048519 RepID=A0A6A6GYN5_VIRVR|nr:hypothetical protein EV356DRAFT_508039 [Viridothelium virens]